MADIKLVIKISEDSYKATCNGCMLPPDVKNVIKAIKTSTPLPKGQKLIILSEDAVKREQTSLSFSCQNWISEVGLSNATVTIIEADKEK